MNETYDKDNVTRYVSENKKIRRNISIVALMVATLLLIAAFMPISSVYINDNHYLDKIMPKDTPRLDISISPLGATSLSLASLFKPFDDPYDVYYELEDVIKEPIDNNNEALKELLNAENWDELSKETQNAILNAVDIGGYFIIMGCMMCKSTSVPAEVHITGVLSLAYIIFSVILLAYSIKSLINSVKGNEEEATRLLKKHIGLVAFILPLIILLCYLYSFSYMGIVSVFEEYLYLQPIVLSSRISFLGYWAIIASVAFLIGIIALKLKKDKKSLPVAIKRGGAVSILSVLLLIFALSPIFKTSITVVPLGEKVEKEIEYKVSLPFFNTLEYYNHNMWLEAEEYKDKTDKEKHNIFDYISHEFSYYDSEKLISARGEHINTNLVRKLYFTHSGDFVKNAGAIIISRIGLCIGALILLWQNLLYLIYDRSSKIFTLAGKGMIFFFGILSIALQIGFTLIVNSSVKAYTDLGFNVTFCYFHIIAALFSILISMIIRLKSNN